MQTWLSENWKACTAVIVFPYPLFLLNQKFSTSAIHLKRKVITGSPVADFYTKIVDRDSAYERLKAKATQAAEQAKAPSIPSPPPRESRPADEIPKPRPVGRPRQGVMETMAKSAARTVGSSLGRQIIRGILGSIFKGK